MTQTRQVAIIGAGIGREHLAAYQQLPERFTVHTLCDLDEARALEVLKTAPATHYTDSLEKVLSNPDIDLVDVCLPPHLHFETCERALLAGKSVVCEKPLVSSVRDADRLIELAKQTGLSIFPVFQYRYGLGGVQMRKLIDSGLAGKAYTGTLETHWNRGAAYYEPEWRGTWAGEQGGAVLNHAIHMHDWLSFVFGPVGSVYADLAPRVNEIEVEDCASMSLRMQSGALVTSSITLGAANDTSRLRFCFEGLTAESGSNPYAPAQGEWTFIAREPYSQSAIDEVLADIPLPPAGYPGLFSAIADALDGQPGQEVTLVDGRRSLEFVSAVYASAREKKPVELPLTPDHASYSGWGPT
ncbi:MAG: Gfo/Idh/MocA family oxidoreductase [Gammaproteobacteria bacterium]|nr:Gfo/Idh/MocA family oxidoreductase [Gammaproteobacteria bacterium]